MFGKALILALASSAALLSTQANAANLVTNGGFETGSFSGWTLAGNNSFTGVTGGGVANEGAFGAFFGSIGSTGSISQTIATTVGQQYLVSFALHNDAGTPNSFLAAFGGSTVYSATNSPAFGYTVFSGLVTATSASSVLSFTYRQDPAFQYLDSVSVDVAAVPEPATWAMMITGFGLAGAAVRRRSSNRVAALA